MELLTTTEMAERWEISRRRVTTLCREGRIEGAILKGNTWLIPNNAEKPALIPHIILIRWSFGVNLSHLIFDKKFVILPPS